MSCQFEDGKVPCRDMNEKEDEILWEAGTQEGVSSLPNSVNSSGSVLYILAIFELYFKVCSMRWDPYLT